MKITILYVSKTGNTDTAAEFIGDGILSKYSFIEVKRMDLAEPETFDGQFLLDSEAVIFGSPVYFGNMQWQMKQWFDTSMKYNLRGKLGGAFSTEQSMTGGAEVAILTMMQHMIVKGMLVYAPEAAHFGPVAIGKNMDDYEELFNTFGVQFAEKTIQLFGK